MPLVSCPLASLLYTEGVPPSGQQHKREYEFSKDTRHGTKFCWLSRGEFHAHANQPSEELRKWSHDVQQFVCNNDVSTTETWRTRLVHCRMIISTRNPLETYNEHSVSRGMESHKTPVASIIAVSKTCLRCLIGDQNRMTTPLTTSYPLVGCGNPTMTRSYFMPNSKQHIGRGQRSVSLILISFINIICVETNFSPVRAVIGWIMKSYY